MMSIIKEAFQKVKEDILLLNQEVFSLKKELNEIKNILSTHFKKNIDLSNKTDNSNIPTNQTNNPTNNLSFKPLNTENISFSTGNEGVPADRQTDRQTDRQPINNSKYSMEMAVDILNSLDNLKKEIRVKFKKLTDQEFLVFSKIYQLGEEKGHVDYKLLSSSLNLTESSIRDYIGKIIKKDIPIEKIRVNNKNIQLKISDNLKKIASLPTIFKLRDI